MGDEGDLGDINPCACIWNHDLAMQRLLSILRQSQAYCTDNECLTLSRLPGPGNASNDNDFTMVFLFMIVGMLLYALRPKSLRQLENGAKARDSDSGSDGEPPLPPPAVN